MKRFSLVLVMLVALSFMFAPSKALSNFGNVIRVPNDFPAIQAAVDAADPGTTILVGPGIYFEMVTLASPKNDLRLLAQGKPGEVVLDGQDNLFAGIYLIEVNGVRVEGFTVRRFQEAGILADFGGGHTIRKNVTTANGHDGIQLFNSSDNVVEQNTSFANPSVIACGINLIGSGSTGNIIRHNEVFENGFGIQAAAGAADNMFFHNNSSRNRRYGIRNISANGTVIENNRTLDNVGTNAPPTEGRGIGVINSNDVSVTNNRSFGNTVDIFHSFTAGFGSNTFEKNHCQTSIPAGLCSHGH